MSTIGHSIPHQQRENERCLTQMRSLELQVKELQKIVEILKKDVAKLKGIP